MRRLTRIETICFAAAVACLALSGSIRLWAANTGNPVEIAPADRSEFIWITSTGPMEFNTGAKGENIDINSADAETLTLLPGIGDVLASRIIEYREENGAFTEIEEIMNVSGIGRVTFDKLKDYIIAEEIP